MLCCAGLQDIRNAAAEENMELIVPAHLNRIDKVCRKQGYCRQQVQSNSAAIHWTCCGCSSIYLPSYMQLVR
jgi:hypothetical protein